MSNVSMPLLELVDEPGKAGEDERATSVRDDRRPVAAGLADMSYCGVTVLCAESGMGKTNALMHAVASWQRHGGVAKYVDLGRMDAAGAIRTLKDIGRRTARRLRAKSPARALVACDNVCAADEADCAAMVACVRRLCAAGASVALAMLPEAELLCDLLPEARRFWSCDMRVEADVVEEEQAWELFTHGIPLLADACDKARGVPPARLATHPSYQDAYVGLVASSIRESILEEERRVRCAMLLLGQGTRDELEMVTGGFDEMVWRLLARDAPIFGVDVLHRRFGCVGCQTLDCLSITYVEVSEQVRAWPTLVARAAHVLCARKDYARAAFVSTMCSDVDMRCAEVLRNGTDLVDAGEVDVVSDALADARERSLLDVPGYDETLRTYAVVVEGVPGGPEEPEFREAPGVRARHAWLWAVCAQRMRGVGLAEELDCELGTDAVSRALVTHANALSLMAQGRLADVYDTLLDCSERLEGATLSSAVVGIDFCLCSLLMGIVPSPVDLEALERSSRLLAHSGLRRYERLLEVARNAGTMLGGRLSSNDVFDAHIQWADREDAVFLRGLLLLAAAVSDMRLGALTRAHVRMSRALDTFAALEVLALAKMARLLDAAIRAQLGERVPPSETRACEGVSKPLDVLVHAVRRSFVRSARSRPVASGRGPAMTYPRDLHWLVNVLCNDCGPVSKRLRDELPRNWQAECLRVTSEVDRLADRPSNSLLAADGASGVRRMPLRRGAQDDASEGGSFVQVTMLGGFEVRCGTVLASATRLERRRARPLLALLVAMPSHAVKRFVVMESLWPTKDYAAANKCLYSATNALKTELAKLAGGEGKDAIVCANRADGTISLNGGLVRCDVDVFEDKAHEVLDLDGDDRRVVEVCRDIEDVYKGNLFVPPMDGMGVVEARSRELAELFADAMVTGANAGLRLGMKTLSCRFARKAHKADPMREDAIHVLVRALCAAGRRVEAERSYERYVGRVVDFTDEPPSRQLREAVEELLWKNPRRVSRRQGAVADVSTVRVLGPAAGEVAWDGG